MRMSNLIRNVRNTRMKPLLAFLTGIDLERTLIRELLDGKSVVFKPMESVDESGKIKLRYGIEGAYFNPTDIVAYNEKDSHFTIPTCWYDLGSPNTEKYIPYTDWPTWKQDCGNFCFNYLKEEGLNCKLIKETSEVIVTP